ncbi:MAG: phosphoribosyl-ATP diphosphatase [Halobacteria archaeon]
MSDIFEELYEVIEDRRDNPSEDSYTSDLLEHDKGENMALEKLGEETTELILASKDEEDVVSESADLVYHLFVVLAANGVEFEELKDELKQRRG